MSANLAWSNRVVLAAVLLTGFGAAHLVDDFLYGVPADLGISDELGQGLAVVYFVVTSLLIVLAARGRKIGYIGNLVLGGFLLVADIANHGADGLFAGSWRSGLVSTVLAFGVIVTAIALTVVSCGAWRYSRRSLN